MSIVFYDKIGGILHNSTADKIIIGLYNAIKGDQLHDSEQQIKTVFNDAKKYIDKCFSESIV